jgi:hypothetical protein
LLSVSLWPVDGRMPEAISVVCPYIGRAIY